MTTPEPLSTGTHTLMAAGLIQRYHVYGTGPVCLVHPGGPGVFWECLRMPAVEQHLTMVYVEAMGTGASGRLASHPNGYTRHYYAAVIDRLINHLGQDKVYLLGHSYGGFVAQRYAVDHPDRLTGLILFESSPVTGHEHGAEAARQVQAFARRNADNPELPAVIAALQSVGSITDDAELTRALRALLPAYFADYWGREAEFDSLRELLSRGKSASYPVSPDASLNHPLNHYHIAAARHVTFTALYAGVSTDRVIPTVPHMRRAPQNHHSPGLLGRNGASRMGDRQSGP